MRQLALPRSFYRAARLQAGQITEEAAQRAHQLRLWHEFRQLGVTAAQAAVRVGTPVSTLWRWQHEVQQHGLTALNDRSSRPHTIHTKPHDPRLVACVKALREQFPRWGKDRLAPLLKAQGWQVSAATVGRILTALRRSGQLKEPHRMRTKPQRVTRPHATRKPKEYLATQPGDILQIDTLDLRPLPGVILKQFTAIDVVSRYLGLGLRTRATATTAKEFLLDLLQRLPFTVRAIQVDGGSEFKEVFEQACQDLGLPLFVLPPRSPKLNGCVERANRSCREEFWECYDGDLDLASAQAAQRTWETCYNTYRPHQALGWRTPQEYLAQHTSAAIPA